MSSSWKSYGGIYKTHKINNLGVGTIVTDRIIVRKQNLAVQVIEDNLVVDGYQETKGNVLATQNTVAISNVFAGNSVFIDNRLLFINNLVNDSIVDGTPTYNNASEPILTLPDKYQNTYNYIGGNATSIGIGTDAPRKFFEVYENNNIVSASDMNTEATLFSVGSHRNITNSVLISNQDIYSAGVKAKANGNNASLEFHASDISANGNAIATLENAGSNFNISNNTATGDIFIDAMTVYLQSNGTTKIDVSDNVIMSTQLSISNTNVSNSYLKEYYIDASSNYETTNGLVLNASDASANIFQSFVNTNNKGLLIGGGGFAEDNSISTGTMGLFSDNNSSSDSSFVPIMTICEGTSKVRNRTTMGINTYSPDTNNYTLDINGKTRIGHAETHIRVKPEFVVKSMSFSKETPSYGMVVGGIVTDAALIYDLSYAAFVTENGGEDWTRKEVLGDGEIRTYDTDTNSLSVHVSGTSYAYILVNRYGSLDDLFLYTADKGTSWTRIQSALNLNYNNIFGHFDTSHNIFASSSDNDKFLYYYTVKSGNNVFSTDISNAYITNHFIEHIAGLNSNTIYSTGQHLTDSSGVIGKYVFDASNGGTTTYEKSFAGPTTFNHIAVYDENNAVAVGNNYIAYTSNGGGVDGSGWNLISNTGFNLHNVYLSSSQYGIAIGAGVMVYSTNNYATWEHVPDRLLDSFGMKNRLMNNLDANSRLTMSTSEIMFISHAIGNVSSDILYNYIPTFFNENASVMDVSGAVQITGTLAATSITSDTMNATSITSDTMNATSITSDTMNSGQTIQF